MEVNNHVNYPIKAVLNDLVAKDLIDMSNDTTKFCVSWVTCKVSNYGLPKFVLSWNHHTIPSKSFQFFFYTVIKLTLKVCQCNNIGCAYFVLFGLNVCVFYWKKNLWLSSVWHVYTFNILYPNSLGKVRLKIAVVYVPTIHIITVYYFQKKEYQNNWLQTTVELGKFHTNYWKQRKRQLITTSR